MGWNISIGWMGNLANLPNQMRSTAQNILFIKIIIEEYIDFMRNFDGQSGSNVLLYKL